MKNPNKIFNLIVAALFVVFFAIITFLILKPKEQYSFAITPEETLKLSVSNNNFISPVQLAKKIVSRDSAIVLVDIRNQFDYINAHLPESINIYKADILEEKNYKLFEKIKKENKIIVLYGNNAVEANVPFMILRQVGIDNVKVLNGGFPDFKDMKTDEIAQLGDLAIGIDKPALVFFSLIKSENEKDIKRKKLEKQKKINKVRTQKPKKTIKVKKHKINIPEPEEEDEGC